MERVFVDTSGWVALFVENDINHSNADSIYNRLKRYKTIIYTSGYIIDETITTILSRSSHEQSIIAGEALLTNKVIRIIFVSPHYLQTTWELYQKYKGKRFSFTDVSSFSIMKSLNIKKAFAFDREFQQAGFELLSNVNEVF